MTHADLKQAKALAAIPCPDRAHDGWNTYAPICTTCDGKGTLAYQGEWPQLVWECLPGREPELSWEYSPTHSDYPAPHPVDALMWFTKPPFDWRITFDSHDGPGWYLDGEVPIHADNPSALLDAVLKAVG